MNDMKLLELIYTFFLGVLVAIFIGVGINTFYPPPAAPKYPVEQSTYGKELTAEQVAQQRAFDKQNEQYQEKLKPYNRNVSIITLAAALILLTSSILLQRWIRLIANGLLLGGLFTLLYSIGRGFASQDSKYVFIAVSVSLAVVLYLGYYRFVSPRSRSTPTPDSRPS